MAELQVLHEQNAKTFQTLAVKDWKFLTLVQRAYSICL